MYSISTHKDKEMKKNFTDACRKYAGDRPEICQEMQKMLKNHGGLLRALKEKKMLIPDRRTDRLTDGRTDMAFL